MAEYEILEHTADVGVRASGATLEECFEQCARGLLEVVGIDRPGRGERTQVDIRSRDHASLLVDFLNEIVYLIEARDADVAGLDVSEVTGDRLRASIDLAARTDEPDGVQVKAVTYHDLVVERSPEGFVARVYFDV